MLSPRRSLQEEGGPLGAAVARDEDDVTGGEVEGVPRMIRCAYAEAARRDVSAGSGQAQLASCAGVFGAAKVSVRAALSGRQA